MVIPNAKDLGRGQIDRYTDFVKEFGAKGLAYVRVEGPKVKDLNSPILKYLSKDCLNEVFESLSLKQDDLVFFGAGKTKIVNEYMSRLINKIGIDLNLISEGCIKIWFLPQDPKNWLSSSWRNSFWIGQTSNANNKFRFD